MITLTAPNPLETMKKRFPLFIYFLFPAMKEEGQSSRTHVSLSQKKRINITEQEPQIEKKKKKKGNNSSKAMQELKNFHEPIQKTIKAHKLSPLRFLQHQV